METELYMATDQDLYEDDDSEVDEEHEEGFMCSCGHYETSGFHCEFCGAEPPWGCDCGNCTEPRDDDDYFDNYEY